MSATQIERLNYYLSEYMASEGFTMRGPTVEEGHVKACLAYSAKCVLENVRDDEGITDYEFNMRLSSLRDEALEYLNSELVDCQCPKRYEEDSHYLKLHRHVVGDGDPRWTEETVWMNLNDAVTMLADDVEYGWADMVWVGLHDFHDDAVDPCLWASITFGKGSAVLF